MPDSTVEIPALALDDVLIPRGPEISARLMRSVKNTILTRAVPAARVELAIGQHLNQLGGPNGKVWLIESGAVSLEHYSPKGRRTILDVLPPNEFFGEDCLPGLSDQYTPSAFTTARLLCLDMEAFHSIVQETPISNQWRTSMTLRVRRHRSFLLQHATSDCEARFAMRLFDMACAFGTRIDREIRIDLRLRHEDYAAIISTTRSRVGFFLQRFTERGMLRKSDDGLLVVNPTLLVGYIKERMGLDPAVCR